MFQSYHDINGCPLKNPFPKIFYKKGCELSFLRGIAIKRKQLKEAGGIKVLIRLRDITVFEKIVKPVGVWRTNRENDGLEGHNNSLNLYDGLWINALEFSYEYFDFTFEKY